MVATRALIFTAMMMISLPATAADNFFSLAKDKAYVTYSAGWFDIKANKDAAPEFSLEYHDDTELGWFKPFLHASYVTNDMTFLGAGLRVDLQVGDNWIVQPSLAATWWRGDTDKLDLGYPLIFRSRLEVGYRFKDKSRLGLAFTHSSNAHLDKQNPGSETLMLNVSVPLTLFAF